VHVLDRDIRLFDSYHCSRYNTNTGRLTPAMVERVFVAITRHRKSDRRARRHGTAHRIGARAA